MESLYVWYHIRAALQTWRGDNMNIITNERGGMLTNILLIVVAFLILLASGVALISQNYWPSLVLFVLAAFAYPIGNRLLKRLSKQT